MFYEGRIQKMEPVTDLIGLLNNGQSKIYHDTLFTFELHGRKFGIANDQSNCNGVVELALLDIDNEVQFESWTIGWQEGSKIKALNKMIADYLKEGPGMINKKIPLKEILAGHVKSWFTCGCCGEGFRSTLRQQKIFDQDDGYGICRSCTENY